ncbi:MAG: MASE1 domain-containing protein [Betaproteobacteria bacterium]|nr:MASE1 domain-containing protein [Betaproteobacteria bacterium]
MIAAHRMRWTDPLLLIAGYVALDWASFFHPLHGLSITPWNPAPALGLVFVLRFGWKAVYPLVAAVFLGDWWVRELPMPLLVTLVISVFIAGADTAVGEILRRRLRGPGIFSDRRSLLEWAGIVIVGTCVTSFAFAIALRTFGVIPADDWLQALAQSWIGDGVGILVTMPLLWMLFNERDRAMLSAAIRHWEAIGQIALTVLALWIAFGLGAEFKYFYVLFLPIVWAAARQGLAGAVLSAAIIQVGIIGAVQWVGLAPVAVLEIQMLAVVLALLGFFVGVVVDEQQRISSELRQTLRLAAAGEMAGAIAHELNQPLTAVSAYGSACEALLEQGETGDRLKDAIRRMIAESVRAAEVIRRLRDFFRAGTTRLEPIRLADLVSTATGPFVTRAAQDGIDFSVSRLPEGVVLGDRAQLEIVIRNLLSNAFDAVSAGAPEGRSVRLSAELQGADRICIGVEDSGPGLSSAAASRLFEPFSSSKASGLGLGLAISRAIAEAHGGALWTELGSHGVFRLTLPAERKAARVS